MHAPVDLPTKQSRRTGLREPRPAWLCLLIAFAAIGAAYVVRAHFPGSLETRLIYATYYPGVIVATLIGGLTAGVLATAFSVFIISLWVAPPADLASWLGLAIFSISASAIVIIIEMMIRARSRAKEAEEQLRLAIALKNSEQQLRTLIEQASDGIFVSDSNGFYIDVNSAGCRMLGYDKEELLGRHIHEILYRGDTGKLSSELAHVRAGKTTFGEWHFVRKDGTSFIGEVSAKQLADGRIQAFLRDVTDRKQNEEHQCQLVRQLEKSEAEAREQQALFRSIFEGAPEAVAVTDTDRHILMVNPAFTSIFGYDIGDLIGASTSILYENADEFEAQSSFLAELQDSHPVLNPRIIRFRRKDGTVFPGEIVTAHYVNGIPRGYIGIIRDISLEQKKEEELRQAQRLDALARLTGGICHDFNNLLAVILGNLQLLEMMIEDRQLKEYIQEAEQATEMGARLSQRLVTFSRQGTLTPVACNLNDQVTQVLELLRRTLGENISITISLGNDLWETLIDPSEVDNAILNLAINARDAMPKGGTICINTRNLQIEQDEGTKVLPAGKYVTLSLRDTGTGMPPEVLQHAFEPFFTTKEPGKGTGLGLSSIYGFVKESGGHITLESEVGRGTVVTLYLPKLHQSRVAKLEDRTTAAPMARGAGELVLVVEDNAAVRRVTRERIQSLGYRTLEADNGLEATAILARGAPVDVVFSDIIMPGMMGLELARKIKGQTPSARILLTSGVDAHISKHDDEFAILRKPYNQVQLADALSQALHGHP
jgi:PAS domain S-box-containing protein